MQLDSLKERLDTDSKTGSVRYKPEKEKEGHMGHFQSLADRVMKHGEDALKIGEIMEKDSGFKGDIKRRDDWAKRAVKIQNAAIALINAASP